MPVALDSCIASIYEPGNPGLGTDSGSISIPHYSGFLLLEETTDHFELSYEDDVTEWFFEPAPNALIVVAGTWSGTIRADHGVEGPPGTITFVETIFAGAITGNGILYQYGSGQVWRRYHMMDYVSGTALIYVPGAIPGQRFLIEEGGATIGSLKLE